MGALPARRFVLHFFHSAVLPDQRQLRKPDEQAMLDHSGRVAQLTSDRRRIGDLSEAGVQDIVPVISDVYQTVEGGGVGTPITDGEVFFILQYGLSLLGLADVPGAIPPVYT